MLFRTMWMLTTGALILVAPAMAIGNFVTNGTFATSAAGCKVFSFLEDSIRQILMVILLVGITVVSGDCSPVALQNATATFSQTFGSFFASGMIDGNFSAGNGWTIADNNVGTVAQTAVFETTANQGIIGGTLFTFTISQLYGEQHTIGRYRISLTTDDRSLFADGLQAGGDVTANWTVLTPATASGTGGPTFSTQGDGSVLVSGTNPSTSVYTLTASTLLTGITGFRLEVLEDPSLPTNGPGRQPSNGNLVVTEFQVDATPSRCLSHQHCY